MLWIKEVEIVETIDDLMSSRSVQGHHVPNFENLDAKIASGLDKIIQNSYFKTRVSQEEQKAHLQNRFLRRRQIAFMICEWFRVTGAHDSILVHADLFSLTLRNDDVLEFDPRWVEILSSLSKISTDDVLETVYQLGIRESDPLKTVLELYEL